jgi:hypothetical protein
MRSRGSILRRFPFVLSISLLASFYLLSSALNMPQVCVEIVKKSRKCGEGEQLDKKEAWLYNVLQLLYGRR